MHYDIYTDGACSGNPGAGGYAFYIIPESKLEPILSYGGKANTTNNHMELMAIVKALKHVARSKHRVTDVTLYSDSAYCVNSIVNEYVNFWAANGWKTKQGKEVKNRELWETYVEIRKEFPMLKVKFVKVKGHSGNKYNELVDKAAKSAIPKG